MRVITEIGEQGLTLPDGREMFFRPSLYAMTQIGDPKEIVATFAALYDQPALVESMPWDPVGVAAQANVVNRRIMRAHWQNMLFLSWQVLYACASGDPRAFIGEPGVGYGSYRVGPVDPEIMLVMARSLMRHGLVGPVRERTAEEATQDGEDSSRKGVEEFVALDYVSKAVTHLGMSESEAWNMTITSFGAHWRAKFGENKEKRYSSEHDSTMKWLKAVNEARAAKR